MLKYTLGNYISLSIAMLTKINFSKNLIKDRAVKNVSVYFITNVYDYIYLKLLYGKNSSSCFLKIFYNNIFITIFIYFSLC